MRSGPHNAVPSSERFLVTGVLGCLGAWTARLLVEEGADVVGLDLGEDPRRLRELLPDRLDAVTLVQGDVTSLPVIEQALDQHEITNVIHLAALQIPFCRDNPPLGAAVNVLGTVNVLEAVKRRLDRIGAPVVYASSAAYFGEGDAARATGDENADSRPSTHYGVFKQANEGNARIYWQDEQVPSFGLRPYNVYGPARDQGITAEPTHAMKAAAGGDGYHINYGGRVTYNHAADVARAFIAMSRTPHAGSAVFNMPGTVAHMSEVVAAIEAAAPEVAGRITFDDVQLPLPAEMATGGLTAAIGEVRITSLAEGVRQTVEHYRGVS